MSLLDSKSEFDSRAQQVGLVEDVAQTLSDKGISSLAQLGFAAGTPGTTDETSLRTPPVAMQLLPQPSRAIPERVNRRTSQRFTQRAWQVPRQVQGPWQAPAQFSGTLARFAPVLPSASPREALPKTPVPAGSAPARPSASPREALPKAFAPCGSAPVRPSAPLQGAFPLAPVPGGCGFVHPAVHPVDLIPIVSDLIAALRAAHPVGRDLCRFVQLFFHSRLHGFSVSSSGSCPSKAVACLAVGLARAWRPTVAAQHEIRCLQPALVVLAPPCGTASRARDIPAYSNGKRIANPLRSGQHPDGLPLLRGHDLARVTSANSLYAFTAAVAGMCSQHGIPWLIENPARSYMWDTSMMSALPEHSQTEVHFCAYGGARRKRTVLKGVPPGCRIFAARVTAIIPMPRGKIPGAITPPRKPLTHCSFAKPFAYV